MRTALKDSPGDITAMARQLREQRVGANIDHAQVIIPEEENKLLDSGAMIYLIPKSCHGQFSFMSAKH